MCSNTDVFPPSSAFFTPVALLCGINGYASFIDELTAREIGSWQVPDSGCFEYFDGALPANGTAGKKLKRHAAHLKGNCSDHMTGLAAASFGLFARVHYSESMLLFPFISA